MAAARLAGISLLAGLLVTLYTMSNSGSFHIIDEVSLYAVTDSLVRRGAVDTNAIAWTQWTNTPGEVLGAFGPGGEVYSKKGVAPAYLTGAWVLMLRLVGGLAPEWGVLQGALLWNGLVTAATAGLLWLVANRLGYGDHIGCGLGLLFGLATAAWPYATHLFGEPLSAFSLLACFYGLLSWRHTARSRWLWVAGSAGGVALTTVTAHGLLVAILTLYGFLPNLGAQAGAYAAPTHFGPARARFASIQARITSTIPYFMPLAIALGLIVLYNWSRFGSPWQSGYHFESGEGFTTPLLPGLWGLLGSPYRGLFWHTPLFLASLPAAVLFGRRHRGEGFTIIMMSGVLVALYSLWWMWWGGFAWGPRFLVPLAPFWVLMLAPLWEELVTGFGVGWRRAIRIALAALIALSILVQWSAVVVNYVNYEIQLRSHYPDLRTDPFQPIAAPAQKLSEWADSPVLGQFRLMSQGFIANSDLAWLRGDGTVLWWVVAVGIGGLVSLGLALALWWRRPGQTPCCLGLLGIGVPAAMLIVWLTAVAGDPRDGTANVGYRDILAEVDQKAGPRDAIVSVAPFHYQIPFNWYAGPLPVYGYATDSATHDPARQVLEQLVQRTSRIWFVTGGLAPADPTNSVERWLAGHAFKAYERWYDDFRLLQYGTSAALDSIQPRQFQVILADSVDQVVLVAAATPDRLVPGQVLPVSLSFRRLSEAAHDLRWFVQLLDEAGTPVALLDTAPEGGYTLFSDLPTDTLLTERVGLLLPDQMASGTYRLIVGLYDPSLPGTPRLHDPRGQEFVLIASWDRSTQVPQAP